MKRYVLVFFNVIAVVFSSAQKFTTEKGHVSFFSDASVEDIKAHNEIVGSMFDASNGELVYIVKNKDFSFDKPLMREHFNEKYIETEKFVRSTFQGKIVSFKKDVKGVQNVKAIGKLNIHGVTRNVEIPGTLEFLTEKVILKSKFMIRLLDYDIKIPKLLWQNIAEEVEVKIEFTYKPL